MSVASNRVAVFSGPGRVELRSEPVPEPGRGEALVQIRACGLCTMEQRLWTGSQDDYPIAAGHEAAGVVVALHAEGVVGISAGQQVAIAFLDRCMQCEACRRGDSHLCTGKMVGREKNVFRRIGGLADYAVVPAWKLFPMPAESSLDEIALCEPLACVIHSVNKAGLQFGDDVLVIGGGTMGYLHLLLARLRGARVVVSDPDPEKRRLALAHGAMAAFGPAEVKQEIVDWTRGAGVDAVFVTFGTQDTAAQASASVRPGGRIICYGSFPVGVAAGVDASRLHHEEIVLTGSRGQTLQDWHQASRLVARNLVDLRPLISGRFPLERLSDALERATEASAYRIIVNPS
jgi:threonine dehydrogenase-like Zn-dependent dehydrogenase